MAAYCPPFTPRQIREDFTFRDLLILNLEGLRAKKAAEKERR